MAGKASTPEERVEQLLEYCNDREWNTTMEKFMVDECYVFEEYDESLGEYSLKQTDTYQRFLELFEEKLEDYMLWKTRTTRNWTPPSSDVSRGKGTERCLRGAVETRQNHRINRGGKP